MTLSQLNKAVQECIAKGVPDNTEVKVWLPGSKVSLSGGLWHKGNLLLLEGNLDAGSALC